LNNVKIDTRTWGNSLGTALGTAYLIQNLEQNLFELFDICDQLVCISHWYEKTLSINGVPVNKLNYIEQGLPTPVGIDPIEFKKETNLRLLFLGRISPFKGLHLLLDALDSFSESDIQLSIYGNGDGSDYEIMLREKTINKTNVHWLGNLPQLKVQEVMQSHDLLCLCSTICEMSPLVIQEARAAKLPVLASNVYGNSEQMKEGAAGFLFEINNVESLKVKLALILKKRSVLQEQESKIKSPRSFQDLGASYEEVYKKTLNQ
jgi:glycosyltransferase involved in cell wall biosynthesis